MARTDLPPMRLRFCVEYVNDPERNATKAAIAAGYSPSSAYQRAYEMMKRDDIRDEIKRLEREMPKRIGVDSEKIIQEFAAIGFANIQDFLRAREVVEQVEKNYPKIMETEFELANLTDLTRRKMAAVGEVIFTRDGNVRIKMHDKIAALDKLSRILGLYEQPVAETPADAGRDIPELERAQRVASLIKSIREAATGPAAGGGHPGGTVEAAGQPGEPGPADAPADGVRKQGG